MEQVNIDNPFNSAPVYHVGETESTMKDAETLVEAGKPSGSLVFADYQTKGRGRIAGRIWESGRCKNLLCTIIFKKGDFPFAPSILPLLAGLGVAKTLERFYSLVPEIKWPNDILVDGEKICGILCEAKKDTLFCGMGLNCNQLEFPGCLKGKAASIKSLTGRDVSLLEVLGNLLKGLKESFASEKWNRELNKRLYRREKNILIKGNPNSGDRIKGTIKEVNQEGHLVFIPENSNIPVSVLSGEIEYGVPGNL